MKILVADDKEEARYLLSTLLTGHGYAVATAANGAEALELLRSDAFDVVISDILMPVMDGFQLCREVRQDEHLKSVLFVFYTATYTTESDAEFARQLGADDFILKPAEPEVFLARMQGIVERASEKGWTPRAPEITDEADVLRLYSERLVAKLEKRNLDLDRELAERRKAEQAAAHQAERLGMLRAVDMAILEAQSPVQISETVLDALDSLAHLARGSVVRFDAEAKSGEILAVRGEPAFGPPVGGTVPVGDIGDAESMGRGELRHVYDLREIPQRTATDEQLLRAGIVSYAIIPLRSESRLIGSLNIGFATPGGATAECVQVAEELGNQLAIALSQSQLHEEVARHAARLEEKVTELSEAKTQLERSYERLTRAMGETVQALATAAEVRDPYTAGHQKRVTELAIAIAEKLGMSAERLQGLRVAGLIHDIGKLAIPSEILSKPSKLTALERSLIERHPRVAWDILGGVEFPWPVQKIVVQHHERIDGSGYPDGLHEDEILLEARILAVADVVEAMASHRPYRPALGLEAALAEIRAGKGKTYDAQVAEACVELLASGEYVLDTGA